MFSYIFVFLKMNSIQTPEIHACTETGIQTYMHTFKPLFLVLVPLLQWAEPKNLFLFPKVCRKKEKLKKEYFGRKSIFLHSNVSTGLIILHKIRYNV